MSAQGEGRIVSVVAVFNVRFCGVCVSYEYIFV